MATYVGENLYVTTGRETPGLIGSAIQDWYSEKSGYNFVTGSCSGVCGHYIHAGEPTGNASTSSYSVFYSL